MKPTLKQIFFFVFLFFGIQCKVIASGTDVDINDSVLLKKLQAKVMGNETEYLFFYNESKLNKISYSTFDGATKKGYFKVTYNGNLISKIQEFSNTNNNIFTSTFTYTDSKLTSVVKEEIGKNKAEKLSFSYNSANSVTVERRIGNSTQQLQLVESEIMYFKNDKLVKKVENGIVSNSTIFEYDNANNPLQNVIGMDKINVYLNSSFGIFSSSGLEGIKNNRIKQTVYSNKGNLDHVLVFNTSYTKMNFPDKKMSPPNSPGSFEYQYYYQ